jgi:hypothetical protein
MNAATVADPLYDVECVTGYVTGLRVRGARLLAVT